MKHHVEKLLAHEEAKRKILEQMEIKYDFPGYVIYFPNELLINFSLQSLKSIKRSTKFHKYIIFERLCKFYIQ